MKQKFKKKKTGWVEKRIFGNPGVSRTTTAVWFKYFKALENYESCVKFLYILIKGKIYKKNLKNTVGLGRKNGLLATLVWAGLLLLFDLNILRHPVLNFCIFWIKLGDLCIKKNLKETVRLGRNNGFLATLVWAGLLLLFDLNILRHL